MGIKVDIGICFYLVYNHDLPTMLRNVLFNYETITFLKITTILMIILTLDVFYVHIYIYQITFLVHLKFEISKF